MPYKPSVIQCFSGKGKATETLDHRGFYKIDLLHDSYNAIISLKLNELTAEHVIASAAKQSIKQVKIN